MKRRILMIVVVLMAGWVVLLGYDILAVRLFQNANDVLQVHVSRFVSSVAAFAIQYNAIIIVVAAVVIAKVASRSRDPLS
jgi:hypothetical protein